MDNHPSQYDALVDEGNSANGGQVPKTDSDKIGRYRRHIDAAKQFRTKGEWDKRWSKFYDVYANRYEYPELGDWEDTAVPNMVFSTVNVIVPSIAVNNPKIIVTPLQPEDEMTAPLIESVVNDQWRSLKVQDQVRQATKDATIAGHGWVKTTWVTETEDVKYQAEEYMGLVTEALMTKRAALESAPGTEADWPTDEETINSIPTSHPVVTKDDPDVTWVSIFDVFVDPDTSRLQDARWIAHRIFEPIQKARENPSYDEGARKKLKTVYKSKSRDNDETDEDNKSSDTDDAFAEIWEYYDLINGLVCTFADGCSEFLIKPQSTKQMFRGGHPFRMLENYEVPDRFFPIGDVETIFPLQLELAFIRTAQLNDMKRGRRITLFRESALGEDGMNDLRTGKDNVMIPVLKDVPFQDVFAQISSQGLQPEWYQADQKAIADINIVSGISEYVRGGTSDIRRTATEVGVMQDQTNARLSDKLSKIESFMADIAMDMIWLSQRFLDAEHVVRIVADNEAVGWEYFQRDALQGEFHLTVEAGSSQPMNETFREQQAMRLMDTFGGLLGTGVLNDKHFISEILRLNGFKNAEQFLGPLAGMPPPPPVPGGEAPPGDGGASQPVSSQQPVPGNMA